MKPIRALAHLTALCLDELISRSVGSHWNEGAVTEPIQVSYEINRWTHLNIDPKQLCQTNWPPVFSFIFRIDGGFCRRAPSPPCPIESHLRWRSFIFRCQIEIGLLAEATSTYSLVRMVEFY